MAGLNKELRDKYCKQIELLNGIKELKINPFIGGFTTIQTAEFFGVCPNCIRNIRDKYKEEFANSVKLVTIKDFKNNPKAEIIGRRGGVIMSFDNGDTLDLPNVGVVIFAPEAIMRIGMLLEKSPVAKELQEKILEIEANASSKRNTKSSKSKSAEPRQDQTFRIFKSKEFGSLRTIEIDGEPWFVGKDVAGILGYKDNVNALKSHVDEEDKLRWQITTSGQRRDVMFINESGLYSLILSSKLPTAKEFKRWVTNEILPSIRKHGAYMTEETLKRAILEPDFIINLATELKNEQEKNKTLSAENTRLSDSNKDLSEANKALAEEVLTWTNRKNINAIVRKLSAVLRMDFGRTFNYLYKELLYKHGISLTSRAAVAEKESGKRLPLISYIRDDEWAKVEATIAAICEKNGIDTNKFFKEATNQALKGKKICATAKSSG